MDGTTQYGRTATTRYNTCPGCGGQKSASAQLCRKCDTEQRRAARATRDAGTSDRHERYEMALLAGYTVPELTQRAYARNLPTRAEIVPALIRAWFERVPHEPVDVRRSLAATWSWEVRRAARREEAA